MSKEISAVIVMTGAFSRIVNAANTDAGDKQPGWIRNASGTIIGASQTAHSMVEFATLPTEGIQPGKWFPRPGSALAVAGSLWKTQWSGN